MKDQLGNEIDKITEHSIQMRVYIMANKLDKANWIMAHAIIGKRTKEDMRKAINEATDLIYEVKQELIGR